MSIPTTNLYNFVTQALENQYRVKYFYPYGQKMFKNLIDNIEDEDPYEKPREQNILLCHDQEPLDFDLYNDDQLKKQQLQLEPLVPDLQKALANAKRDQKLAVDKAVVEAKYEAK